MSAELRAACALTPPRRPALACPAAGLALWAGLVLLATPVARAAPPERTLPARNLLIEWRAVTQGSQSDRQAGIESGRVIIDTRRGVIGRAGVAYGTVQTEHHSQTTQQLMVLNGGRARLFFGRSQQVTSWQWGGGGWGGAAPTLVPQTTWVDLGQGLELTPRWPGGQAPVVVELVARSTEPERLDGQLDAEARTRRSELATTVSLPLGEWTVLARHGGSAQRSRAGTYGTRELDEASAQDIEVRITAP